MNRESSERHAAFAALGLQEIAEDFADEIERAPSSVELCDILTWGLRSCADSTLRDVHPANVVELRPKLRKGARRRESWKEPDEEATAVDDLNDQAFGAATRFLTELSNAISADIGQPPTLKQLCQTLIAGFHRSAADMLADVDPKEIADIEAKVRKRGKVSSRVGDIVAIPTKDGRYLRAVVLAKNDLGTAYGLFEGAGDLRPISADAHPPPRRYPVYSSDAPVAGGEWKIIGHDEVLLNLFTDEPEIYHADQLDPGGHPVGPFGSAETPSGEWRDLSREEAEEIGLLNGKYRQFVPPEYLEQYLVGELP